MEIMQARAHLLAATLLVSSPSAAWAQVLARTETGLESVTVTARLRPEDAQQVPLSLSVVDARILDATSTYNTSQLSQLVPSLNYNSPNPRNTSYTIRGLGSSVVAIAQSNDGLEPGVGFYVDQVYHARPATAAFDFLDVERVEVLRGPQGTLFGKNTTSGAIAVLSKAPTFETEIKGELSGGEYGYAQAKAAINGSLIDNVLAARVSFAATRRDGVIQNVNVGGYDNNIGEVAVRGQLLYQPSEDFKLRLTTDYSSFNSKCCTQVYVRVGASLKPAAQQYPGLAAAYGYTPASTNPYDRKTDVDAAVGTNTNEGGVSAIGDWTLGAVTLTSVSAWRYWNWNAANDRDYTRLVIQTHQHIPSRQDQYSQEFRIASNGSNSIDYVGGLYFFSQIISGAPITQYGPQAANWLLTGPPAIPGNLLDGYGTTGITKFSSKSYAAFGEATWRITDRLSISGGMRYTYEDKHGSYASTIYGGPAVSDPLLIAKQLSILRPQTYTASVSDGSASGRANASYNFAQGVMGYVSYARASKSGGINMSGLPLNASNLPALSTAVIKPEENTTVEAGLKTELLDRHLLLNIDAYTTSVHNFQTNIVDTGPGALRGYLANIDKVRVQGVELDGSFILDEHFSGHVSGAYTDGKYVSYRNGPCPLEKIGTATTVCDLSGRPLSAQPVWVFSVGGEYVQPTDQAGGQLFLHGEMASRSKTFGDPSDSKYTVIDGYNAVNASLGYRDSTHWEGFIWARNLFDRNYMLNYTIQAGNSGLILGTPNDPRMFGVTIRAHY